MLQHNNFLNVAFELAKGSKCVSRQTGAVIVQDGRILSTWINGTPKWYTNCNDYWNNTYTPEHHDWSYKYEIHAEMNALVWAARNGIKIDKAVLYSTYQPCFDCTRAILAAGITEIYYKEKYKHHTGKDAENFIHECGWKTQQIID